MGLLPKSPLQGRSGWASVGRTFGRRSAMNRGSLSCRLSALGIALVIAGTASAADVHVMISAGFYQVYAELGPAFERATGHHLVTTRGPSMGDSPEAIPTRLARGEAADVVI